MYTTHYLLVTACWGPRHRTVAAKHCIRCANNSYCWTLEVAARVEVATRHFKTLHYWLWTATLLPRVPTVHRGSVGQEPLRRSTNPLINHFSFNRVHGRLLFFGNRFTFNCKLWSCAEGHGVGIIVKWHGWVNVYRVLELRDLLLYFIFSLTSCDSTVHNTHVFVLHVHFKLAILCVVNETDGVALI